MIKRPVLFTIIFLCFVHVDGFAQVTEAERQALVDLYVATDGDNWHRNDGWLEPDSNPCDWEGVRCLGSSELPILAWLRLEKNNLTGAIPNSIGHLDNLQELLLSGNRLEGEVPAVLINDLPKLLILDLSNNHLSGPFPEFRADSAVARRIELNLSRNRFDDALPPSWSQMSHLVKLDLSGNLLTGLIQSDGSDLGLPSSLLELRLRDNRLTEFPSAIAGLEILQVLDLTGNDLSGPLPDWLGQLHLTGLFLQHNRLSGPIDNAIHAMTTMVIGNTVVTAGLLLSDNHFSGPIPVEIMNLSFRRNNSEDLEGGYGLTGLDLCWNDIEPPGGELLEFVNSFGEGADLLACLGNDRRELDATSGGSWYDPARSGEGFTQQVLHDGRMFVYWFSFSPWPEETGRQFWAVGATTPGDTHVHYEPVFSPEGGRFAQGLGDPSAEFDPSKTGRVQIVRTGGRTQQARFSQLVANLCQARICPDFTRTLTGTYQQSQLTRLAGTTCDNRQPHQDKSAIWLSPHSDEGFVVEVIEDGRGVVYWFTYEPNDSGRQAWMMGVGEFSGNMLQIGNLIQPVGGRFGPDFDPAEVERVHWGSLTVEFTDFWDGEVHWDSVLPDYGQGSYAIRRLTRPMLADCGG